MPRWLQLAACIATQLAFTAQAHAGTVTESLDLELAVGENQTLPATNVKSYSEGVAGVVEVKLTPSGSHFVVVGLRPGNTTLLLLERDGREVSWNIRVFARPAASVVTSVAHKPALAAGPV